MADQVVERGTAAAPRRDAATADAIHRARPALIAARRAGLRHLARRVQGRPPAWPHTWQPRHVALLSVASVAGLAVGWSLLHPTMIDMLVYRADGAAVLRGRDPYTLTSTPDGLPVTYPPFAGMVFVALAWLPVPAARAVVTLANLGLLALVVVLSLRLSTAPAGSRRRSPSMALALFAACVWLEPVYTTMRYGQINLLLVAMVLGDLLLLRGRHARWAGVGVGLAAAVKLTPAIFVVHLLLSRRRRAAATAAGTFLAAGALGALVQPGASWDYWTRLVFATGRVGLLWNSANQSLAGALCRLTHAAAPSGLWIAAVALVGCGGLAVAAALARRGLDLLAAVACGVTGLLCSPISWTHHWVWLVPALAELVCRAGGPLRTVLAAGGATAVGYLPWLVPHHGRQELREHGTQYLLGSSDVLLGLGLLAALTLALRGPVPRPPALVPPPRRARPDSRSRRQVERCAAAEPGVSRLPRRRGR